MSTEIEQSSPPTALREALDADPAPAAQLLARSAPGEQPVALRARDDVTGAAMMLELAIRQNLSPDQINHIVELQRKVLDDRARRAFFEALAAMQSALTPVPKTKWADMGGWGFYFADLGDMQRHVQPLFAEHQLSYRWDPVYRSEAGREWFEVKCHAGHALGWEQTVMYPVTIDRQPEREPRKRSSPSHQESAALTTGQRRSFGSAFGIVTEQEVSNGGPSQDARDAPREVRQPRASGGGGGHSGGGVVACTPGQVNLIGVRLDQAGVSEREFIEKFQIAEVADLPKSKVDPALAWIDSVKP